MTEPTNPNKYRPPVEERRHIDRTEPVRIDVRTRWLYSEDRNDLKPPTRGDDCPCCPGRHAFSRGGAVVRSDVPSGYDHMQDLASHIWRAVAKFGDDRDLVIEVRPRETATPEPTPAPMGLTSCPECVQGKHPNCDGTTWDNTLDGPATCPCASRGHRDDGRLG